MSEPEGKTRLRGARGVVSRHGVRMLSGRWHARTLGRHRSDRDQNFHITPFALACPRQAPVLRFSLSTIS